MLPIVIFSQREAKVPITRSFSSFSRVCVAQVTTRSLGGAALALSAILHGSCMNTMQRATAKHAGWSDRSCLYCCLGPFRFCVYSYIRICIQTSIYVHRHMYVLIHTPTYQWSNQHLDLFPFNQQISPFPPPKAHHLDTRSSLSPTAFSVLFVGWAPPKKTATMDAIKKKMQAMKLEKDNAMDRADTLEQQNKEANNRAEKVTSTSWRRNYTQKGTTFKEQEHFKEKWGGGFWGGWGRRGGE